ncbi:hypothetical protein C8A01DRAFT_31435 [Parachaetomium inaequale]|uniref:Uncharacterized protein n=1 Tax=Parachaetomium inaequale TaxID=2588326 RepID=A0AAN6PTP6_9PEZI|nr:hypothetical protein C8A01DRAFT_31435 [Parachaetomium inaequale]
MSVSDNMEIDFSFEDSPEQEAEETQEAQEAQQAQQALEPYQFWPAQQVRPSRWTNPRDKRSEFNEFRARALQLRVHERHAPLLPSPLRNVVAASDLPDPDLSDAETVDDPLFNSTVRSDATSSDSDGSTSPASSTSDASNDSDEPGRRQDETEDADGSGAEDLVTSPH